MVKIRLSRGGSKKRPYYHVVAVDSRKKRDGAYIEVLGYYNPLNNVEDQQFKLNEERILNWYRKGAQPSDTVRSLIKKQGIQLTSK